MLHVRVLMSQRAVTALVMRQHGRVRFEHEDLTVRQKREVDSAVVQIKPLTDSRYGIHRTLAERGEWVLQEAQLLVEFPRVAFHIGGEIMRDPVRRDYQMVGKLLAVHVDHAVLAVETIR